MKKSQLLKHLKANQCFLLREGAKHSVFFNAKDNKTSTVPRHKEINDFLAKKICKDLGVQPPL